MAERGRPGSTLGTAVSPEVVGREIELAHLRQALDAATRGDGGVVFVLGEAGIGKSRLAHAVASDAARGRCRVLRGRAVQTATPAPYRPLAEALSSAVRAGVGPGADELGPFGAALGRLVRDWRVDNLGPLDESLVAVGEAVLRFLRATAGNLGALVVLEDLHWADPETLEIVEYLADNLAAEHVLCVVTVREERSPGLELARSLHARRVSRLLQVGPLDQQEVEALVASCLATPTVSGEVLELAARGGGIPFLVEELLAVALASGALVTEEGMWRLSKSVDAVVPITYSESMARRVDQLGEHVRETLVGAAVLGRRFEWSLLPAMTGLASEEVLAALHQAVDAQIVIFDRGDGSFRFRHELSRDAVLAGLFPPEIEALSRRALQAVESAHPNPEEHWRELAADLAAGAGDRRRAARLLLEVGRQAFDKGALASAEATLARAGSLVPGDDPIGLDVDEGLLQVLALAGKVERAAEVATSLLARLGNGPQWARRRAEIHLRLARAAFAATQWDEAHALVQEARLETLAVPAEDLTARVDAVHAQTAIMRDPRQAAELAQAALDGAERLGLPDVACEALEVLGRTHRRHDVAAAEATFARALAVAEANKLALWRMRALHELGTIDMLRGRPVGRLEDARELALAQGALATAAVVDVQVAAALVVGDDPKAGVVAAQRSAELAGRYRLDQTLAAAVALEAHGHARLGQRSEMQRCIDEALALAPGVPDIEVKTSLAAAVLELVEEDRAGARHHLCAAVVTAASGPGGDYSAVPAMGLFALLRQLDGLHDDAGEVEMPQESVHFMVSAFLRYADAVAAGRRGEAALAVSAMAEGDRTLERHRWLRNLGRRLVAEAAVADGWGDPIPWLREALDFFDRRGDDHIASACRSILRKAGVAVPRRRGEGDVPGELRALGVTSRELEVLRLLAMGLPNKEIGARLYLSPRTVERHVANLTVKLGAARRSELVAYAARTSGADAPAP